VHGSGPRRARMRTESPRTRLWICCGAGSLLSAGPSYKASSNFFDLVTGALGFLGSVVERLVAIAELDVNIAPALRAA
jgi:hypothetical protein